MRLVGLSDLDVAIRALLSVPRGEWRAMATDLIAAAHAADQWRESYGVAHPGGGTGSLYAQATLYPRVATSQCSARYCAALGDVLTAHGAQRGMTKCDVARHRFVLGKLCLYGIGNP